jgi:HNH endonuclease
MKEIKLTRGKIALVDDADFESLNSRKWYAAKDRHTFYASANDYSGQKRVEKRMHWVIMGKPPKGYIVDHKDRNGLNNQRGNLRICTRGQNNANRKAWGKSKFLGVTFLKGRNRPYWEVRIKGKYLGAFKDEKEAAMAYNKAAVEVHGEFANLNDINVS